MFSCGPVIRHGQVSYDRRTFEGAFCHSYQSKNNGNWYIFFSRPFEVEFIFLLHSGFPPGDYDVSRFLVHAPFTPNDPSNRAQAFLISLFETTANILPFLDTELEIIVSSMRPADRPTSYAEKSRLLMTAGQRYSSTGKLRGKFYYNVIHRAKQVRSFDCFRFAKSRCITTCRS
jgi:hypothetical protein